MTKFRLLIECTGLAMLMLACGKSAKLVTNDRTMDLQVSGGITSDASAEAKSGVVQISLNKASLDFDINTTDFIDPLANNNSKNAPKVRVTLFKPDGSIQESMEKSGININIKFELKGGDGVYQVKADVVSDSNTVIKTKKPWERRILLDTSSPIVTFAPTFSAGTNGASRVISIKANAIDLSKVTCNGQVESGMAGDTRSPLLFALTQDALASGTSEAGVVAGSSGETLFSLQDFAVPIDFPNYVFVRLICSDTYGFKYERVNSIQFAQPAFGFNTIIDAPSGIPYEKLTLENYSKVPILRTATGTDKISTLLKLKNSLVEAVNLTEIPEGVLAREKAKLQIVVSDYPIQNAAIDLTPTETKHIYLSRNYEKTIEGNLPKGLLKDQTLYVSLLQINDTKPSEPPTIISSQPINIYVEQNGASMDYAWLSGNQFIPAVKDAEIVLQASIKPHVNAASTEPPSGSVLETRDLEFSIDNINWTKIEAEWTAVPSTLDKYSIKIKYPFEVEKAFRIRIKGTSVAGNLSISDYSPNLIAPSNYSVSPPPATPCDGAKVYSKLASSFLCQKKPSGQTKYFAMIDLQNNGNAMVALAQDTSQSCGSDYCFGISVTRSNSAGGNIINEEKIIGDDIKAPEFKNGEHKVITFGSLATGEFAIVKSVKFNASAGLTCSGAQANDLKINSLVDAIKVFESAFDCK